MKFGTRDSGFGVRDAGFGVRDSGLGIRGSGFGTRDSGLGTRDSGLVFRDSECGTPESGIRDLNSARSRFLKVRGPTHGRIIADWTWVPDHESRVPNPESRVQRQGLPNPGSRVPDPESRVQRPETRGPHATFELICCLALLGDGCSWGGAAGRCGGFQSGTSCSGGRSISAHCASTQGTHP